MLFAAWAAVGCRGWPGKAHARTRSADPPDPARTSPRGSMGPHPRRGCLEASVHRRSAQRHGAGLSGDPVRSEPRLCTRFEVLDQRGQARDPDAWPELEGATAIMVGPLHDPDQVARRGVRLWKACSTETG